MRHDVVKRGGMRVGMARARAVFGVIMVLVLAGLALLCANA